MGSSSSAVCTSAGSSRTASSPARVPVKYRNVPLSSVMRSSASTAVPQLWAKASAARVGAPLASKAALSGGPRRFDVLLGSARGEAPHQYREAPRGGEA